MNKSELRNIFKKKRALFTESEVDANSKKISDLFRSEFELKNKTIHVFTPIKKFNEVKTQEIKNHLFNINAIVATSVMHYRPFSLSHSVVTSDTEYITDAFDIPTPTSLIPLKETEIDIVLVPLLAYDLKGNRVGYGKGIYDSFLTKCKPGCLKIGVSFFPPVEEISDVNENDVQLNYCITPNKIYNFNES